MRKKFAVVLGLLLVVQFCVAQDGYNYPRPDTGLGSGGTAGGGGGANAVRPIVGGFASAAGTAGGFPTGATAFGGNVSPTQSAYGFGQGQRSGATAGFLSAGAGVTGTGGFPSAASGLGKRPILPQRMGGIYGSVAGSAVGAGQQQYPGAGQRVGSGSAGADGQYVDGDYSAIPGQPGVNYPVYTEVPPTSFDCAQQQLPGYYSDVEAQCQVFHICAQNRTYSFLCPNGTIFSQETLVCVWWNMFDCASAPSLYANNAFIYDYGNQGPPTGSGGVGGIFQQQSAQQLGIVGGSAGRPQSAFQSAGRSTGPGGAGQVFSGNVRPTIPSGQFPAPIPTTAFPGATAGAARFSGPPNPTGGAFPAGPPTAAPAAFGTTIRSGFSPIQDAAFPSGQVSPTTSGREYLPPRRP